METIEMFLKFGKEKDILDLYENGTIYMNPIQKFRKIEDDGLRGDKYEGVSKVVNYPPGEFEIPSLNYKGNHQGIQIRYSYPNVFGNIYSLYCISTNEQGEINGNVFDPQLMGFGSHCLLVIDNFKFLSLIQNRLTELKVKFDHNFVSYYDRKQVNREINLFEKPLEYEYQKEFRIYVERDFTNPYVFNIGSLSGIAEVYPTRIVINEFKIERKEQLL